MFLTTFAWYLIFVQIQLDSDYMPNDESYQKTSKLIILLCWIANCEFRIANFHPPSPEYISFIVLSTSQLERHSGSQYYKDGVSVEVRECTVVNLSIYRNMSEMYKIAACIFLLCGCVSEYSVNMHSAMRHFLCMKSWEFWI